MLRARAPELSLAELFDELRLLSARSVFRQPAPARFGFAGSLGLDLRGALGHLFATPMAASCGCASCRSRWTYW